MMCLPHDVFTDYEFTGHVWYDRNDDTHVVCIRKEGPRGTITL